MPRLWLQLEDHGLKAVGTVRRDFYHWELELSATTSEAIRRPVCVPAFGAKEEQQRAVVRWGASFSGRLKPSGES